MSMTMLSKTLTTLIVQGCRRNISTTATCHWMGVGQGSRMPDYWKKKKKYRPHPWDKRFPVRKEDVSPDKPGGSKEMAEVLPEESEFTVFFVLLFKFIFPFNFQDHCIDHY